jgi:hypothetical protein
VALESSSTNRARPGDGEKLHASGFLLQDEVVLAREESYKPAGELGVCSVLDSSRRRQPSGRRCIKTAAVAALKRAGHTGEVCRQDQKRLKHIKAGAACRPSSKKSKANCRASRGGRRTTPSLKQSVDLVLPPDQ